MQASAPTGSDRPTGRVGQPRVHQRRRRRQPTKLSLLMTLFFVQSISTSASGLDPDQGVTPRGLNSTQPHSNAGLRHLFPRALSSSSSKQKRDTWRPDTELPGTKFVLGDGKTEGTKVLGYEGEWPLWESFRKTQVGLETLGDTGLQPPTDSGDDNGSHDSPPTSTEGELVAVSTSSSSVSQATASTSTAESMSTTWRTVATASASSTTSSAATPSSSSSSTSSSVAAAASQETSSPAEPQTPPNFVCHPISDCAPCPQSALQYPYCRPYNNRRRVSCQPINASQNAQSGQDTNAVDKASPILGWEACGKSPQKEARDYFEFIVFVAFLAISSTLYFVRRQKYLFDRQNLQFHQRISASSRNTRNGARGPGGSSQTSCSGTANLERAKRKRLARVLS